ncbi:MAG: multiheme c-type cytochrome [Armatimonadota bacterium]|nr:multiheme c-type cytochrome [Armatimonadota bacterium]
MDSGNQSDKPGRLDFIMSILADLKYDAIGIGAADRQLEREFLEAASKHSITVVDAAAWNAGVSWSADQPNWRVVPYVVKNILGVKVGVISFGVAASTSENHYSDKILSALKEARTASDILIALDQAGLLTREWLREHAKQQGIPDLVIGGSARAQSPPLEIVEGCYFVQTSVNGSHVGVVDIEFTRGQPLRLTLDRIALDTSVPEEPNIKRRVAQFLDSIGARSATSAASAGDNPASAGYMHPRMCRACHEAEYEDWAATKHARAVKTLDQNKRLIPECLQCHSEAFRRARVINVPSDGVAGIECLTCHRLPVPHWDEKRAPSGTWKVDRKICKECHTPERSAAYDESIYLPKISHGVIAVPKLLKATTQPKIKRK